MKPLLQPLGLSRETNLPISSKPIFIAGATGYIGGHLLPRLLDAGYRGRVLLELPEKLADRPWSQHPNLTVIKGNVFDSESLCLTLVGCMTNFMVSTIADRPQSFPKF